LQTRVGKNKAKFKLYKFATMLKNSDQMGTGTVTVKNDMRILPFGKFFRKTKINELPQLFNILLGHMSIVGPRPLTTDNFNLYNPETQNMVSKTRPGLSGIGSIIFRNEEEMLNLAGDNIKFYEEVITPYKGKLEVWFVLNSTLLNYFKIIFLTMFVVMFPKTKIVWEVFRHLPIPPIELEDLL
jgi:lipopolysaccharide/colanic/teichoic acid biosynthesis glycosyltransferase